MKIHLYNTMTRSKEEFVPLHEGEVRMYVCGPTVYDHSHIGHARAAVTFDIVYRTFREFGFKTTYVRNITDVDDKIIKRAAEEGVPVSEIAERYAVSYQEDMKSLGVLEPDFQPKATETISEMIDLIRKLIDRGMAYVVDGDVFFEVSKFPDYCKLSGRDVEELKSGARIEVDERKKDPLDFALWKSAKPGEPAWDSPWGKGRPGWHIECSAMSAKYLGQPFDIHGGGQDLIFPHHENEIAQSEGAAGKQYVRYWMHNGFVRINKEKMSKSLGNVTTIKEILKIAHPEALRVFLLSVHYRSPLDYSPAALEEAKRGLDRLYNCLLDLDLSKRQSSGGEDSFENAFKTAMADDFHTPKALAVLFDMAKEINRRKSSGRSAEASSLASLLIRLGQSFLGVLMEDPVHYFRSLKNISESMGLSESEIEKLVQERSEARKNKDFAKADEIRNRLAEAGVVLEDGPSGTTWKWRG